MLQYTMGLNNATKTSPTIINLGHCHTCTALPRGDYYGCGEMWGVSFGWKCYWGVGEVLGTMLADLYPSLFISTLYINSSYFHQ